MTATDALEETLAALRTGPLAGRTRFDEPIGILTTYRVGGAAAAVVTVEDESDLDRLADLVAATTVPTLVVGRGSNLLVADEGFPGVAVVLGDGFAAIGVDGTRVRAGGAAKLPVVARATVQHGLTGFEWAVGVPGSVGGAVRMNAGGHGAEMVDSLVAADIVDLAAGTREHRPADRLDLSYRHSSIAAHELVVAADLELERGDPDQGRARIAEIVQWRRTHQPGGQNAGSVFTNPPGDSAGRLIDTAGAKGLRIGSAEVSPKHANFIQADDGGSAADIVAVMDEVRRRVRAEHGVDLRVETQLVGFGGHPARTDDDTPEGEDP